MHVSCNPGNNSYFFLFFFGRNFFIVLVSYLGYSMSTRLPSCTLNRADCYHVDHISANGSLLTNETCHSS